MRIVAATLLVLALATLGLALRWDSATPDFFETGPILGSVTLVSVFAGVSAYAWRRRVGLAIGVGIGAAMLTFVASFMVAIMWWEG